MSQLEVNSINLRYNLETRNLYTPDNPYTIETNKVIKTLNALSDIIMPFKSIDLSNTVIGRLALNDTPLGKIGIKMLGSQIAYNIASNVARQTLPVIDFNNLFDNDPNTKLITNTIDFTITINSNENFLTKVLNTLDNYTPIYSYPFNKNSNNIDFIKNTGKGQLKIFYSIINQNIYKQSDDSFKKITSDKGFKINNISNYFNNKFWFIDQIKYPNYISANINLRDGFISDYNKYNTQEYGTINIDYEKNIKYFEGENLWIDSNNYGFNDNFNTNIIWGRDGIDNKTNNKSSQLRTETVTNDDYSRFNSKSDLLFFTSQLLNATEGNIIDNTKKVFKEGNKLRGFNGSGVYIAPSDSLPEFANNKGIRQHTSLDEYNRFSKAIRFNGNIEYNGNENSVIYKFVIPKIHPIFNSNGDIDNKNLMFSIENLAIDIIKDDKYKVGYLKDDYSTIIPASEIGQNNCRMMWFMPYGIDISENAIAKYTTTEIIGRGEPIYTYNNSERTATLSFKLIIDHPPQLSVFRNNSDYHKRVAEFFEFGLSGVETTNVNYAQNELKLKQLIAQKETLNNIEKLNKPEITASLEIFISFPNDKPNNDEINNIFNIMFNDYSYEISDSIIGNDGTSFGLNNNIYNGISEITIDPQTNTGVKPLNVDQYNYEGIITNLDRYIETYLNETNRNFVEIELIGSSSKLFDINSNLSESDYNLQLSNRRIDAVLNLIDSRLQKIYKTTIKDSNISINRIALGSTNASDNNATVERIAAIDTKKERSVSLKFKPNTKINYKEKPITAEDDKNRINLDNEIAALTKQIQSSLNQRNLTNNDYYNLYTNDDTNNIGFKNVEKNKLISSFYSQTPEDLHKRLTFLHQCTRQGNAIRRTSSNSTTSSNNSVFGKQPVCVLRIGDFFHTKIIIENIAFTYEDITWDQNPEGFGMQPMLVNISMQIKVIGGQSLAGPINVLQNAVSFNYYANSTYSKNGTYSTPSLVEALQYSDNKEIDTLTAEKIKRQVARRDAETNK